MIRKTTICLLLMAMLAVPMQASAENATLQVTASFYPLYIATLNVTRDVPDVAVACLAPASAGCLHDYQMTTADRKALADSDVIILNGAGLEGFLDMLLPSLAADIVDASEGIALLDGHHEGEPNAHLWVSVEGMVAQVRNIANGLALVDPANAQMYKANADAYTERLQALNTWMQEMLAPYAGSKIVTFHEAFDYFAKDFGLDITATVQHEHDSAPSARELANTADVIRSEQVKALFAEPEYEDTSVEILSRETGVKVWLLDPAVSGDIDTPDLDAYIEVMRQNTLTLVEALQE